MHALHRQAFLDRMEDGDFALFPGASFQTRNHDVEWPLRQQSDFLYLSGYTEADATLMLAKGLAEVPPETLFVLPRDPEKETWTGRRLGPEGAQEKYGFAATASTVEAPKLIRAAMLKARRVWYRLGAHESLDELVTSVIREMRMMARKGVHPPEALLDPGAVLSELRLHKSEEELALMRRAAAVSAEAHLLCMAQAAPGMGEWELEALLSYTFRRHGGDGWAYPSIVAGGDNACILHYNTNHAPLHAGDLVLIDAGAEFSAYAADITRTFPVDGRFTGPQRDVYEAVLRAQVTAVEATVPGTRFTDVHAVAVRALSEGLRELGVLREPVDQIVEERLYLPWYMHNTGHWIGLDVHDAGRYVVGGESRPLEQGMCLTVEPGLYFTAGDERVPEALRGIGVRIEDDVLVTGGGNEVLTVATPKSVADVEAACQAERVAPPSLDSELVRT